MTGLRLRNLVTQEESILPVSAMFLGIGHVPNAKMFTGQTKSTTTGTIPDDDDVFTHMAGVFACGDVQEGGIVRRLPQQEAVAWRFSKRKNTWKNGH